MKVAISGFGRIGRDVTRILIQKNFKRIKTLYDNRWW